MDKLKQFTAKTKEKIAEIDIPVKKTLDSIGDFTVRTKEKMAEIDIPVKKTMDDLSSKIKNLGKHHDDDAHPTIQPAATAMTTRDGRIEIEIHDADGIPLPPPSEISRSATQHWNLSRSDAVIVNHSPTSSSAPSLYSEPVPPMHICIMIVGTRGDVQPFIGIGKRLVADGHRVRLATHAIYRSMVLEGGLEFYPLGGDPKELAAYMVKTGGHLIPVGYDVLTKDMPRNIQMVEEILFSTWPAVHAADPGATRVLPPFRANAIISNPVTYGHIHVAEKLGVPLHIMFPQPWVPTAAFPHPLSNLAYTGKIEKKNHISYKLVDLLMWQGTENMVNRFREDVLGLRKIRMGDAGRNVLLDLRIPHSFMWSPHLVPRPDDWDPSIYDVIGTVCDSDIPAHTPTPEFAAFLANGPAPIFVGFGSMVIPDAATTTRTIIEASQLANVRVVLQSSWSDMTQGGEITIPDNVFLLGNCPHDWLFPHMAAVVHHGGAGTTAAGLLAGKPTFIVPFFGDQPFWGWAVVNAGVGAPPCPIADLTTPLLTEAFEQLSSPELAANARALQAAMRAENGVEAAVESFYKHLPPKMTCAFTPTHVATKWLVKDQVQVCDCCAYVIRSASDQAVLDYHVMGYARSGPNSGLEGAANGAGAFVHEIGSSLVGIVAEPAKGYKKDGAKGAAIGAVKGLANFALAPFHGIALFTDRVAVGHYNLKHRDEGKRKEPRFDGKQLFSRNDATFSTATSDEADRDRVHRHSLAPLVGVHVSPAEQAQILAALKELITLKEECESLPPASESLQSSSSVTVTDDDVDDDDNNEASSSSSSSSGVPMVVRGMRWSATGEFHMDYDVRGDLLRRAPSTRRLLDSVSSSSLQDVPASVPFQMNICVLAIGARSEVEAVVAVASVLASDGHHVRLAANPLYESLVRSHGLEFFALQGNPTSVHDWMGRIGMMTTIDGPWHDPLAFLQSTWEAVNGVGFRADLILSHPGVIVHRYLAERLGVPVQLIASSPWSPTSEFPHPLMEDSPSWSEWSNWLSYAAVDEYAWTNCRDILNQFRVETLGLPPWHHRLPPSFSVWKIPITYLWSPSLLSKAHDWGREVSVVGFPELSPSQAFQVPPKLTSFLQGTPAMPTVYVNLSSLDLAAAMNLLHDVFAIAPDAFRVVLHRTDDGVRDILVADGDRLLVAPPTIPVDYLVERCDGVVHQATEEVVRALLKAPKPSMACPVTGIERLWASRLYQLTPEATVPQVPLQELRRNPSAVAAVFSSLVTLDVKRRNSVVEAPTSVIATEIQEAPRRAAAAIYRNVPVASMVCDVVPTKIARVYVPRWDLKLSHEAVYTGKHQLWDDASTEIKAYKPVYYSLSDGPTYVSMEKRIELDNHAHRTVLDAFSTLLSAPEKVVTGRLFARQESMPGVAVDVSRFWETPEEEAASREAIMAEYEKFLEKKMTSGVFKSLLSSV
ncbi:hypothetical protein SPRG_06113 [Saprolegnia parasitica CBS 223.65]|uniref:Uncharacterized protein n=1 Tax=Saprolegnia parasitica (strain CBS 223.65) TaxID=695850 RepID=A0A067CEX6_SAPPC|nr:hypothetical protein SPRG_06113 [Saprolegnia parasitica CBS 223.65]KDO29058.1 hypothetical protein SPRG_06113 [Saprolegnia parasitica CBS 223.65]|eukprot:XP_012200228.1 hypothetical protein SPRG_06113 [Saprolegnia parasitica CBS 223.65]